VSSLEAHQAPRVWDLVLSNPGPQSVRRRRGPWIGAINGREQLNHRRSDYLEQVLIRSELAVDHVIQRRLVPYWELLLDQILVELGIKLHQECFGYF